MVNHSMHESDSGAGQESWRDSDTNPLLRSSDSTHASAAHRETARELAEAVPALRSLSRQKPEMPSAAQWATFTRELSENLDQESRSSAWSRWRASFNDRLAATDSRVLRVSLVTALTAAVAALLAGLLWIAAQFAPAPVPATAAGTNARAVPEIVRRA